MYEFHYRYITSKYSANLLFTETDSLAYEIKTKDAYENFYEDKDLFNFSDYPQHSMELHSKFFHPVTLKKQKESIRMLLKT